MPHKRTRNVDSTAKQHRNDKHQQSGFLLRKAIQKQANRSPAADAVREIPQRGLAAVPRPYLGNLRAITQVIGPAASRADPAGIL